MCNLYNNYKGAYVAFFFKILIVIILENLSLTTYKGKNHEKSL